MRSDNEKKLIEQYRKTSALKKKSDYWNGKPKLISEIKCGEEWRPTIHYLEHSAQVLFITAGEKGVVDYNFHQSEHPFKFIQKIQVTKDDFVGAMIAYDNRQQEDRTDSLVVAVKYWGNHRENPCKIVKITRGENKWNEEAMTKDVTVPNQTKVRLCDCYLI